MNLSQTARKRIHTVLGITTAVCLAVTGIFLGISCYQIYTSAQAQMFTYEKIGIALSRLALPLCLTFVSILAGSAAEVLFPVEDKKEKIKHGNRTMYTLFARYRDLSALTDGQKDILAREHKLRSFWQLSHFATVAVAVVLVLLFLSDPRRYMGSPNEDVLTGFLSLLICFAPVLLDALILTPVLMSHSYDREFAVLKQLPKKQPSECDLQETKANKNATLRVVQLVIAVLAVALIVAGICNGGMNDVLTKAAKLCLECVGMG